MNDSAIYALIAAYDLKRQVNFFGIAGLLSVLLAVATLSPPHFPPLGPYAIILCVATSRLLLVGISCVSAFPPGVRRRTWPVSTRRVNLCHVQLVLFIQVFRSHQEWIYFLRCLILSSVTWIFQKTLACTLGIIPDQPLGFDSCAIFYIGGNAQVKLQWGLDDMGTLTAVAAEFDPYSGLDALDMYGGQNCPGQHCN